jgi:syntaxin 18
LDDEDSDEELELTQSQILQFEDENKALLRDAEDALAAVQQAESRLMEISALQMELVQHLTQQAEITDQLFEDAVQASQTVDAANAQLVRARQRQSDSRLYILVFLLGASAALLFLHNY